jgi:beta-galactosidase
VAASGSAVYRTASLCGRAAGLTQNDRILEIAHGQQRWQFDRATGNLTQWWRNGVKR